MPPLIKLTDGDGNFIYDYRLSRGETEAVFSLYALSASDDLTGYTVTCEGEGCAAAVRDGALSVTCPRGKSCTVTVTDETGTLSDSVYVAHETASIRFVNAIESYCCERHPPNKPLFPRRALLQTLHPRLGIKNLPADTLSARELSALYGVGLV